MAGEEADDGRGSGKKELIIILEHPTSRALSPKRHSAPNATHVLSVSVSHNQVTVEFLGGWLRKKKNVFSACVNGAGDVGWD